MLNRRPNLPTRLVASNAMFGLRFALARRRATGDYTAIFHVFRKFVLEFQRWVAKSDWNNANAVYLYDGMTAALAERVRESAGFVAYEQIITPYEYLQDLLDAESRRFPGWEETAAWPADLVEFFREIHARSWKAADIIICGSDFVVSGIRAVGGPVEKCVVLPYGVSSDFSVPHRPPHGGKLRVLTVGEVGLRKGAQYTLEAARQLGDRAEFRMVGPVAVSAEAAKLLGKHVILTGPLAGPQVREQLAWADIYILPTVGEGSAVSVYEALASGLPVVTTPNCGSVVRDGIDGYLIPIGDPSALIERIDRLIADPELRATMGRAASRRASEFTIREYSTKLIALLSKPGIEPNVLRH